MKGLGTLLEGGRIPKRLSAQPPGSDFVGTLHECVISAESHGTAFEGPINHSPKDATGTHRRWKGEIAEV